MKEEVHVEHIAPRLAPSRVRRVSWGAIFAGMVVTIVMPMMLTLLGVAAGIAAFQPFQQQNSAQSMALGSGIWLLVTGLISVWVGACIAGRLSGGPRRADGMLHGIVAWSMATLGMFGLLATTLGTLLGGAGALISNAISSRASNGISPGQEAVASLGDQIKSAFPQAGGLLPPTGRTEGQQVPGSLTAMAQQDTDLAAALGRMESHGGAAQAPQERDQVVGILTSKHHLSQQEAANLVNQWDQQFQEVRGQATQKASQAGQAAAKGIAEGAFWGFIALILGLLAAAWGGWAGTASLPRPIEAPAV